jgi:hypothetical protein
MFDRHNAEDAAKAEQAEPERRTASLGDEGTRSPY